MKAAGTRVPQYRPTMLALSLGPSRNYTLDQLLSVHKEATNSSRLVKCCTKRTGHETHMCILWQHGGQQHGGQQHGGQQHGGQQHGGQQHGGQQHGGQQHGGQQHRGQQHRAQQHRGQQHRGQQHRGQQHRGQQHRGQQHRGQQHRGQQLGELEQCRVYKLAQGLTQHHRS